jgi:hypothetical protein
MKYTGHSYMQGAVLFLSATNSFYDYHLPEDDNHHSHRRGNLKSYKFFLNYSFNLGYWYIDSNYFINNLFNQT